MARKSTIKQLPAHIRKQIDEWVVEGKMTIDQLHKYLTELGPEALGLDSVPVRSTVGKYVADFTETSKALRESREITSALIKDLGPQIEEGEQGRALVQMLRTIIFRFLKPQVDSKESDLTPKEFVALTRSLRDLSQTMRAEQDFDQKIREEAEKKARAEAVENVAKAGKEKGLSRETIIAIQEQILGVKLPEPELEPTEEAK